MSCHITSWPGLSFVANVCLSIRSIPGLVAVQCSAILTRKKNVIIGEIVFLVLSFYDIWQYHAKKETTLRSGLNQSARLRVNATNNWSYFKKIPLRFGFARTSQKVEEDEEEEEF